MPWDPWFQCSPRASVADGLRRCKSAPNEVNRAGHGKPCKSLCHCDTEFVVQRRRYLACDRGVPAADENRGYGANVRLKSGIDASLDPAQKSLSCSNVLLA